jgi:hypothetical protein
VGATFCGPCRGARGAGSAWAWGACRAGTWGRVPSLVRRPVPPRHRERERTWVARRLPLYAATPDG